MSEIFIPVSAGELIDKITILEIKEERIEDEGKKMRIIRELSSLREVASANLPASEKLAVFHKDLREINISIWESEDAVRFITPEIDKEAYLKATYNSHKMNEARFKTKRAIDELCNSSIQEQKNYA